VGAFWAGMRLSSSAALGSLLKADTTPDAVQDLCSSLLASEVRLVPDAADGLSRRRGGAKSALVVCAGQQQVPALSSHVQAWVGSPGCSRPAIRRRWPRCRPAGR